MINIRFPHTKSKLFNIHGVILRIVAKVKMFISISYSTPSIELQGCSKVDPGTNIPFMHAKRSQVSQRSWWEVSEGGYAAAV